MADDRKIEHHLRIARNDDPSLQIAGEPERSCHCDVLVQRLAWPSRKLPQSVRGSTGPSFVAPDDRHSVAGVERETAGRRKPMLARRREDPLAIGNRHRLIKHQGCVIDDDVAGVAGEYIQTRIASPEAALNRSS
jgi:hypothetical protein